MKYAPIDVRDSERNRRDRKGILPWKAAVAALALVGVLTYSAYRGDKCEEDSVVKEHNAMQTAYSNKNYGAALALANSVIKDAHRIMPNPREGDMSFVSEKKLTQIVSDAEKVKTELSR